MQGLVAPIRSHCMTGWRAGPRLDARVAGAASVCVRRSASALRSVVIVLMKGRKSVQPKGPSGNPPPPPPTQGDVPEPPPPPPVCNVLHEDSSESDNSANPGLPSGSGSGSESGEMKVLTQKNPPENEENVNPEKLEKLKKKSLKRDKRRSKDQSQERGKTGRKEEVKPGSSRQVEQEAAGKRAKERPKSKSESSSRASTPGKRSTKVSPQKGPSPPPKKRKVVSPAKKDNKEDKEEGKEEASPKKKKKKAKFRLESLLPDSEKGQRPVAEFRCPYCPQLCIQRNVLTKHLRAKHAERMIESEPNGFTSAMTRAENLRKPGARVMDRKRALRHLKEVRRSMPEAQFSVVWLAMRRILCEAMVILGEESEFTHRRYQDLKTNVTTLLSPTNYSDDSSDDSDGYDEYDEAEEEEDDEDDDDGAVVNTSEDVEGEQESEEEEDEEEDDDDDD